MQSELPLSRLTGSKKIYSRFPIFANTNYYGLHKVTIIYSLLSISLIQTL